jgi:hypothetical protein
MITGTSGRAAFARQACLRRMSPTEVLRPPALTDLLAGQTDFLFDRGVALPHIKAGNCSPSVAPSAPRSFDRILTLPATRERIAGLGGEPASMTPEQFQAKALEDSKRFANINAERRIVGD